jgi:putative SOS response-associated peptidase YedK
MCGRFTMAYEDWDFMMDYFGLTNTGFRYPPQYNIAPTQKVRAIISDGKERRIC